MMMMMMMMRHRGKSPPETGDRALVISVRWLAAADAWTYYTNRREVAFFCSVALFSGFSSVIQ